MTNDNQSCTAPFLALDRVAKQYAAGQSVQQVLRSVSLKVNQGECVALLGHSGSGKSTLLNIISGIDRVDQGEVRIGKENITRLSETQRTLFRRKHIGFIYQSFNLIQTLSALENVLLPLQLNSVDDEEALSIAHAMLDRVGLLARVDAFPDQLSGGEQQRVAIARAMVHSPSLVLADEHTGNLDADTGRRMLDLSNEIAATIGQTIIMVTHSHIIADSADRVLELRDGEIIRDSYPDDAQIGNSP